MNSGGKKRVRESIQSRFVYTAECSLSLVSRLTWPTLYRVLLFS